jgi:hypothetical protein
VVAKNITQLCSLAQTKKSGFFSVPDLVLVAKRVLPWLGAVYSFAIYPAILACRCKYRTFNGLHWPEFTGMDNLDDGKSV